MYVDRRRGGGWQPPPAQTPLTRNPGTRKSVGLPTNRHSPPLSTGLGFIQEAPSNRQYPHAAASRLRHKTADDCVTCINGVSEAHGQSWVGRKFGREFEVFTISTFCQVFEVSRIEFDVFRCVWTGLDTFGCVQNREQIQGFGWDCGNL